MAERRFAVAVFVTTLGVVAAGVLLPVSDANGAGTGVSASQVGSVQFLVSINHTYDNCLATVATPFLRPGRNYSHADVITVRDCDHGKFLFNITQQPKGNMTLNLIFYSSVIEDASPPTCEITWSGRYGNPTPVTTWGQRLPNLLPGCYTSDSREGYHMTYYWFYLLSWQFY